MCSARYYMGRASPGGLDWARTFLTGSRCMTPTTRIHRLSRGFVLSYFIAIEIYIVHCLATLTSHLPRRNSEFGANVSTLSFHRVAWLNSLFSSRLKPQIKTTCCPPKTCQFFRSCWNCGIERSRFCYWTTYRSHHRKLSQDIITKLQMPSHNF